MFSIKKYYSFSNSVNIVRMSDNINTFHKIFIKANKILFSRNAFSKEGPAERERVKENVVINRISF